MKKLSKEELVSTKGIFFVDKDVVSCCPELANFSDPLPPELLIFLPFTVREKFSKQQEAIWLRTRDELLFEPKNSERLFTKTGETEKQVSSRWLVDFIDKHPDYHYIINWDSVDEELKLMEEE